MNKRGDSKVESNDSPEIPDRGETSDIPGLPSGGTKNSKWFIHLHPEQENILPSSFVFNSNNFEKQSMPLKSKTGIHECTKLVRGHYSAESQTYQVLF